MSIGVINGFILVNEKTGERVELTKDQTQEFLARSRAEPFTGEFLSRMWHKFCKQEQSHD